MKFLAAHDMNHCLLRLSANSTGIYLSTGLGGEG